MALATQCPHCQTTFKVAHDQLKLRAGLVRCGACKQIFNGIEHLVPPDQPSRAAPPAETPLPPAPAMAPARSADAPAAARPAKETTVPAAPAAPSEIDALEFIQVDDPETRTFILSPETDDDPLTRMTLVDFSLFDEDVAEVAAENPSAESAPPIQHDGEIWPDTRDDLTDFTSPPLAPAPQQAAAEPLLTDTASAAMPDEPPGGALPDDEAVVDISADGDIPLEDVAALKMTPASPLAAFADDTELSLAEEMAQEEEEADAFDDGSKAAEDGEEPDFVTSGRRRQRRRRIARIIMGTASVLLLAAALGQAAYAFRSQLAAWFPQTGPALASLCELAGCTVELPAQIEQVSIESNELLAQAANGNIYNLSLLLHNRSAVAQAWPHIELTLNDQDGKALLRRVLAPGEYLSPDKDLARGIPARSEQAVKVSFELNKLQASDYRVYLFYP